VAHFTDLAISTKVYGPGRRRRVTCLGRPGRAWSPWSDRPSVGPIGCWSDLPGARREALPLCRAAWKQAPISAKLWS